MSKLRLINVRSAIDSLNSDKVSLPMLKSDLSSLEFANLKSPSASRSTRQVGATPMPYDHLNNKIHATQQSVNEHAQLSNYLLSKVPNCLDFGTVNQLLGDLSKPPFNFTDSEHILMQAINNLPTDGPLFLRLAIRVTLKMADSAVLSNYHDYTGANLGFITIQGHSKNDLISSVIKAINGTSSLKLQDILDKTKGIDADCSAPIVLKYN